MEKQTEVVSFVIEFGRKLTIVVESRIAIRQKLQMYLLAYHICPLDFLPKKRI
jgi:hypothetical protein